MGKRPSVDDYMTIPEVVDFLNESKPNIYYWMTVNKMKWDLLGATKIMLRKDVIKFKKENYNIV